MTQQYRCEVSRRDGCDATGEDAAICNAPGDYCPRCELVICPACHAELGASHDLPSDPIRMQFRASELLPYGLAIGILGYQDRPTNSRQWPSQILVEVRDDEVRVHIWNGSEKPAATVSLRPIASTTIQSLDAASNNSHEPRTSPLSN